MARVLKLTSSILVATVAVAQIASAAGDPNAGKDLFVRCAVCHTAQKGAPNRLGPNLFGVSERKSGSLAGYAYSGAMGRSHLAWDEPTLTRYLMGPSNVVPGTKMTFAGFSNQQQAADVAAYLATLK